MPPTQAKRKATADMTDSPPKRVTRARGKATDDGGLKPTATRIVTASAKIAAEKKRAVAPAKAGAREMNSKEYKDVVVQSAAAEQPKEEPMKTNVRQKKPAVPARPSKRKTRADDEAEVIEEANEEPTVEDQPKPEPVKAKGRPKKAVTADNNKAEQLVAPKPRDRQSKAAVVEEAPKTRGRPKKAVEPLPVTAQTEEPIEEPAPVKKATRGRAATVTSKRSVTAAPKPTTAATKKRVKFQEEPDKENVPIESATPKKSAMKPTGMKAKPVRKPAATRGSTRGRKAIQEAAQDTQEAKKRESMPLSPKKDKQVAKSDPASSEDELSGAKTPLRVLSKSPVKRPMSPIKDFGSVSKLNFNQHTAPSSPVKTMSSTILACSARRPPASPFKDALKSSPKKVNLGESIAQPMLLSSRTPMKSSLLQESPKRGIFRDSTMKPILASSQLPFKASLLQSPARRPTTSPTKLALFGSPDKSARTARTFETASPIKQKSPSKSVSSPAKAPKQDTVGTQVHEESTVDFTENDAQSAQPENPKQQEVVAKTVALPEISPDELAVPKDAMELDRGESREDDTTERTTSPDPPAMFAAPAFKTASSVFRRISIESESEDELASPQKGFGVTPLRQHGISTKDFGTPAVIGVQAEQQPLNTNLAFTPLVDQLSSWAASSPDKKNGTSRLRQTRGVFSLGGSATPAGPDMTDHVLLDGSPAKLSFFDDEMVMIHDQEDSVLVQPAPEREQDLSALQVSQESIASEDYGDENTMPNELEMLRAEQDAQDPTLTCTPAKVFTPARAVPQQHREFHTVSKVPLRAAAEDSPLKVSRQRSRSFGGPLAAIRSSKAPSGQSDVGEQPATPVLEASTIPQTPSSAMRLDAETPGRTVRKGVVPDVLKAAVVYVDVHTTEGADASGLFVDLLTQMGARCVKQWNWNPRASMGSSLNSNASPQGMSPDTGKVGITHVVYKDGGKRTLEKVRSSNSVVLCVGVGWVLE